MRIHKPTAIAALALALAFAAPPAKAEEWKYDLAIYLMGAGIDGKVGAGPFDSDVDVAFSDILNKLDVGAMSAFRASKGRWAVMTDVIYVGLSAKPERVPVDVEVDQLILEVDVGYRLNEIVEVLLGGRYLDLDNRLAFRGPLGVRASAGDSWVDPVVGLRLGKPLAEKWTVVGRLDAGGFGIGSDFTFQTVVRVEYRVSPRTSLGFGWRYLDIDYEGGNGRDRFKYDVAMSGPLLGAVFHF